MTYLRCQTCGFKLVHGDRLDNHAGHRVHTPIGEVNVIEWLKLNYWELEAWIKKLLKF